MPPQAPTSRLRLQYVALFLAIGIFLPYFPVWLAHRGFSTVEIGSLIAAQIAIRVVSTPLAGALADRSNRRPLVLTVLALVSALAATGLALATSKAQIVAATLLMAAAMSPLIPISEGEVLQVTRVTGINYGRLRLWGSAAFVAANLGTGAIIDGIGTGALMALLAATHLATAVTSRALPQEPEAREQTELSTSAIATLLKDLAFTLFVLAAGLAVASHAAFYTFSSLLWRTLGYDGLTVGALWATGVVAEILLFFTIGKPLSLRTATLFIAGGAFGGIVRWLGFALTPPLVALFLLQCLHAASFAMVHLGAMNFIRHTVRPALRSTAQTLYSAISGGVLLFASTWAAGRAYAESPSIAFVLMAGLAAVACLAGLALWARCAIPRAPAAADA
ncbi:MAG: MFS transporter [Hyphomicrobiales bacterium]